MLLLRCQALLAEVDGLWPLTQRADKNLPERVFVPVLYIQCTLFQGRVQRACIPPSAFEVVDWTSEHSAPCTPSPGTIQFANLLQIEICISMLTTTKVNMAARVCEWHYVN